VLIKILLQSRANESSSENLSGMNASNLSKKIMLSRDRISQKDEPTRYAKQDTEDVYKSED
jgi:hypothetical protein